MEKRNLKVAVIMGSDSDYPIVKKCIVLLKKFNVTYEAFIYSAHRTPHKVLEFAENAEKDGFGVIIAAAGKAAHLAGVLASYTTLPVIGLPIKSTTMDGLDSLLSVVQMPPGVPVATVAIDGGVNAALLAVQILSLANEKLGTKLKEYRKDLISQTEEKDTKLREELRRDGLSTTYSL